MLYLFHVEGRQIHVQVIGMIIGVPFNGKTESSGKPENRLVFGQGHADH